jgi:G3E family GTPase
MTPSPRQQSDARTPIVIIGGFLGSGKTTLLKHLLEWEIEQGRRPQVIMSEFGDFDVDGAVISDDRLDLAAVAGGCICCGSRDELAEVLSRMLRDSPGSPVYIEATGVAEPAGVLAAIAPVVKAEQGVVRQVVVVYDAGRHGKLPDDAILVERQLMATDYIILNKTDLVPGSVDAVARDLAATNPAAAIIRTVGCAVDAEAITQGVTAVTAGDEDEDLAENYRSFAFQIDSRLDRQSLDGWLATLPADVIRVKGFVRLQGENGLFEVQATQGQHSITPFPSVRWEDAMLIAIAHPMPAEGLVEGLQACVAPED